ncbi:MAG: Crp/Fnr family transcriptional regulator [Chloroflexota bacterium]
MAYFRALPEDDLAEVARSVHTRLYAAGQVIILEGDECPGLYIVRTGRVRVYKASPSGKQQVLRIMTPVDSFNDVPVFDGGANPASAAAMDEDTQLAFLSKADAERLQRTRPSFGPAMLRVFATRLRHLAGLVEDLSFHSVRARLARALIQSAEGEVSRLTQRELADMVGTAREVAGRELRQMEAEGLIRLGRGRMELLDTRRLERVASGFG